MTFDLKWNSKHWDFLLNALEDALNYSSSIILKSNWNERICLILCQHDVFNITSSKHKTTIDSMLKSWDFSSDALENTLNYSSSDVLKDEWNERICLILHQHDVFNITSSKHQITIYSMLKSDAENTSLSAFKNNLVLIESRFKSNKNWIKS